MLARTEKLLGPRRGPKPLGSCHGTGGILSTPGMQHCCHGEPIGLSPVPLHPWAPLGARSKVPTPAPCRVLPRPPGPTGSKSNPVLDIKCCVNPGPLPSKWGFPPLSRDHFWEA